MVVSSSFLLEHLRLWERGPIHFVHWLDLEAFMVFAFCFFHAQAEWQTHSTVAHSACAFSNLIGENIFNKYRSLSLNHIHGFWRNSSCRKWKCFCRSVFAGTQTFLGDASKWSQTCPHCSARGHFLFYNATQGIALTVSFRGNFFFANLPCCFRGLQRQIKSLKFQWCFMGPLFKNFNVGNIVGCSVCKSPHHHLFGGPFSSAICWCSICSQNS